MRIFLIKEESLPIDQTNPQSQQACLLAPKGDNMTQSQPTHYRIR